MHGAALAEASTGRSMPALTQLQQIKSALGAAGPHLGDLVWWTLGDAATDRATLVSTWTGAGLLATLLPEPPTAEKALKTAVRTCQVGESERLIRLGKEDEQAIVYALVREQRLGDGSLSHAQEARVILQRASEQISSDNPTHELAARIQNAFRQLRNTHTADDVRRAIVKALQSFHAITLRDSGGVYWVPRTHSEDVRRLERAISRLGTSVLSVLPVHDTVEGAKALGAAARGSLEDELRALRAELEEFKTTPPERSSTLERRLQLYAELSAKAQLYRDILKVQVDDLNQDLDGMAATIRQLLGTSAAA
jgi:hypothetical protein